MVMNNRHIDIEELEKLGNLELLAKQVVEGFITGLHKSPFHGFSVEFAEHRQYNSGESTRHIDWKLFARTEKLFVKRYEEETNLRCQIIIDSSSSMYYPESKLNKLKFSAYATAALMNLLKRQRDAFGLSLLNDQIQFQSEIKSSNAHYHYLLHQLDQLLQETPDQQETALSKNLDLIAEKIHRRSLVIVFSDFMETNQDLEELFRSLQHLKFNKHEVILFHVQHTDTEEEFHFSNRPHLFIDPETGQQLKVLPNEVRAAYLEAHSAFIKELKNRCAQNQIELVSVNAELDFDQVLLPFLMKRSKLF